MELKTGRLILREFHSADFEDYLAYILDVHLREMLGLGNVFDRPSAQANFDWLMENRKFIAVCKKESGRVIGHICLHPPLDAIAGAKLFCNKRGASLSYALAAWERHQGLMQEALTALCGYLRDAGAVDYLDAEYLSSNLPSQRLLEKLGFQYWGIEKFGEIVLTTVVLSL